MDKTVMEFLNKGKTFRASKNRGSFILVERDPVVRVCVRKWLQAFGRKTCVSKDFVAANDCLRHGSGILVFGIDSTNYVDAFNFLNHVESKHAASFSLVYTSHENIATDLRSKFPRISVLIKGDAMDELMKGLNRELPQRLTA